MPDKKQEEEKDEKVAASNLDEVMVKANKKYGAGTIGLASTAKAADVTRMETGVFALDSAMGGGIPLGRLTGFFGDKSSGKSSMALRIAGSARQYCRKHWVRCVETEKKVFVCLCCGVRGSEEGSQCPDCKQRGVESKLVDIGERELSCPVCKKYLPFKVIWMDCEGTFENKWAAANGVNCRDVYLIRTEYAEQAIDLADSMLRTGDCDLLVIDTVAHLVPTTEIEETSEKWQMGLQARLVNKMLRKLVSAINEAGVAEARRPTILLLNQIRVKLGVMFGDPTTRPGGKGQEFDTSMDVKMWAGKYEQDEVGNTNSVLLNFRVVKNKVSAPQQEGNFRFWLRDAAGRKAGSVDELGVVVGYALTKGLLGKSPKYELDGKTFKNQDELVNYIVSTPNMFETLRNKLLSMPLGKVLTDEEALKMEVVDE